MKCEEYFYNYEDAINFMNELNNMNYDAEPELISTIDTDINKSVYIVYYNPKPL